MDLLTTWQSALYELLIDEDERAALSVLATSHPRAHQAVVCLIEADLSVEEAMAYARVLSEMGREIEAVDVFGAIMRAAVGCGGIAQSGQRPEGTHWFSGDVPQA